MQEGSTESVEASRLLQSVAEQLQVPLTIIARQTELMQLRGSGPADVRAIQTQASVALTLTDSYLLGLQLMQSQGQLPLEPVSVSSLLVETAHELEGLARQYDMDIELVIGGHFAPVMAHHRGLKAALVSLGCMLIGARSDQTGRRLTLAVHKGPKGLMAGMYGDFEQLSAERWRKALKLCGQASQPFSAIAAGSGAGVFVAETILQAMETNLHVGRYAKQYGLAATLQPSQQLQLI